MAAQVFGQYREGGVGGQAVPVPEDIQAFWIEQPETFSICAAC